jgi:SAM-dependent methyltransferase
MSDTERASAGVIGTARSVLRGTPPERYEQAWNARFREVLAAELRPGLAILDVGSGRQATVAPDQRPPGCTYVGLDISAEELEAAEPGSYQEHVVADVTSFRPELENRFDLIVSFQVFEHLKGVDVAFENLRRYLKPGGVLVTQFSGRYSIFGIANRALPQKLSIEILVRLLHRKRESIFPAYYDGCTYKAVSGMLAGWSRFEIVPLYTAGLYFEFSKVAKAAYIGIEEQIYRRDLRNFATYYIVRAVR